MQHRKCQVTRDHVSSLERERMPGIGTEMSNHFTLRKAGNEDMIDFEAAETRQDINEAIW